MSDAGATVSRREAEVLAAVGEFLTNAQIADRLCISVRTVDSHVASLLRKLGAADRRELARLAGQRAAAPSPRRPSLSPPLGALIGRDEEITRVLDLAAADRLVTITGTGGVGKTRLALEVGVEAASRFNDGVVLVELAELADHHLVAIAVAGALGLKTEPGTPPVDTIEEGLRGRSTLLLLDNCEHVIDGVIPVVAGALRASPSARILTTSREPLGVLGERVFGLLPMDPTDARALFVERAQRAMSTFDPDDEPGLVAQICTRLDGLPLAIELAAARVAQLPLSRIDRELARSVAMLDDGARDRPARQRALSATIDWSYDQLESEEREVFARLAVFAGWFSLAAVDDVCRGNSSPHLARAFARLVSKSLVVREPGSGDYRLLEPIRHYARPRLREIGDETDARRRHADHYTRLAEAAELGTRSAGSRATLAAFRKLQGNFRGALGWSFRHEDPLGPRLAAALGWFWFVTGATSEATDWLELAQRATEGQRSDTRKRVLLGRALLMATTADFPGIERIAIEMADIEAALGATPGPLALWLDGVVHMASGDLEGAIARQGAALDALPDEGMEAWRAITQSGYADLVAEAGDGDVAARLAHEALTLAEELGDDMPIGFALDTLAGQVEPSSSRACELSERSLAHYSAINYQEGMASAAQRLAVFALASDDTAAAARYLREALDLHRRLGHTAGTITALEGFARVYAAVGRRDDAAEIVRACAAQRSVIGLPTPAVAAELSDVLAYIDGDDPPAPDVPDLQAAITIALAFTVPTPTDQDSPP